MTDSLPSDLVNMPARLLERPGRWVVSPPMFSRLKHRGDISSAAPRLTGFAEWPPFHIPLIHVTKSRHSSAFTSGSLATHIPGRMQSSYPVAKSFSNSHSLASLSATCSQSGDLSASSLAHTPHFVKHRLSFSAYDDSVSYRMPSFSPRWHASFRGAVNSEGRGTKKLVSGKSHSGSPSDTNAAHRQLPKSASSFSQTVQRTPLATRMLSESSTGLSSTSAVPQLVASSPSFGPSQVLHSTDWPLLGIEKRQLYTQDHDTSTLPVSKTGGPKSATLDSPLRQSRSLSAASTAALSISNRSIDSSCGGVPDSKPLSNPSIMSTINIASNQSSNVLETSASFTGTNNPVSFSRTSTCLWILFLGYMKHTILLYFNVYFSQLLLFCV